MYDKEHFYKEYADYLENVVSNPVDYYRKYCDICEIKIGQKILDFGCGLGGMLKFLKQKFNNKVELHGCDINKEIIKRNLNNPDLSGVDFSIISENNKTDYPASFFDLCFLLDVLETVYL